MRYVYFDLSVHVIAIPTAQTGNGNLDEHGRDEGVKAGQYTLFNDPRGHLRLVEQYWLAGNLADGSSQ